MDNLYIYNAVKSVPQTAMKPISAGRLKGMTDISPMWRIKCLTDQFGPCGIGWYYDIVEKWLEPGAGGEVAAFVRIHLYIKCDGEWSKPIEGIGGSSFIASEKSGLHTSDECYKMALTDAISVACKALGMGADVYWQGDATKYSSYQSDDRQQAAASAPPAQPEAPKEYKCCECGKPFEDAVTSKGKFLTAAQWYNIYINYNIDKKPRCMACMNKLGTRIPEKNNNG